MEFDALLKRTLGERTEPFPFQRSFAETPELPSTVRVPTGLGKTATVILGWVWRRFYSPSQIQASTPSRLVYCLPMRTLVEQTTCSAQLWIDRLELETKPKVHALMGGEAAEDWDLYPEEPAILIGTQDMLLSRALNRGYSMSRYRWPLPFGLLNNDCLWVFDEVQLMDVGATTGAQLEGFRRDFEAVGPVHSIWMSATLQRNWLNTVDFPANRLGAHLTLSEADHIHERVRTLWSAAKPLVRAEAAMGDTKACAAAILDAHLPGTKTLAVFNTVKRAAEVFAHLQKRSADTPVKLIHSRFRPKDRQSHITALLNNENVIAVSTQVVEAGVDLSANVLLTELAPWASLVQRFGRCNRTGGAPAPQVIWFDPGEIDDKFREARPYEVDDLRDARNVLALCEDVSLQALETVDAKMPLRADHVIRRRDLIDLFDTTPDLAGNDIDVSRFIRSGDEHDSKVFWRNFEHDPEEQPEPHRDELCSVPVGELKAFRKDHRDVVWRWDGLDERWSRVEENDIYAGQTYLVRADAGGYTAETGWDPKSTVPVLPLNPSGELPDAHSRDFETGPWLSIAEHTEDVVQKLEAILESIALPETLLRELREAARWHDWGKAHEQFQKAFPDRPGEWRGRTDVAKACRGYWRGYEKKGFRHELASALGMLARGQSDLSVYLAAAHHGKVRMSIRSMPNEKRPQEPERLYARGVWDGDILPGVELGPGVTAPETPLSLEPMQMGRSNAGQRSWVERMLRLRDDLGPFRLAYLEVLLRAADVRASEDEAKRAQEVGQ